MTVLSFVLTVEDPRRFPSSRSLEAYVGLQPRRSQSGNEDPELRITKAGDNDLRRLLIGSAHYILGPFGPDTDLRRWGLVLAARGRKNAKSGRSWPWPASSQCYCIAYGSPPKFTSPYGTATDGPPDMIASSK